MHCRRRCGAGYTTATATASMRRKPSVAAVAAVATSSSASERGPQDEMQHVSVRIDSLNDACRRDLKNAKKTNKQTTEIPHRRRLADSRMVREKSEKEKTRKGEERQWCSP